jgi:pimeloyl-ACP methyl ester carboxylesterase
MAWIDAPRGRLHADDGGAGPAVPVVLVHGGAANLTQWAAQLAHLRRSRRAVALDLPGMGESPAPRDGDYSVPAAAGAVAEVAAALGLGRFVLVGHSYGGAVAAACGGAHPERLAGLVFADAGGDARATPPAELAEMRRGLQPDRFAEYVGAWFETILAGGLPETRSAVLASLRRTPREVFVGMIEGQLVFDLPAALARYAGPRLAIAAQAYEPHGLHHAAPGIPVRVMTGTSHWLMMDRPDEFNALLDEFLGGIA